MKGFHLDRILILALALIVTSCGSAVRQGTGTSFLMVGAVEFTTGNTLRSDVTGANDLASVTFSLGLKDPANPTAPTQNQFITIDRYQVRFTRTDGRNTQGVDVPYAFEGAFTVTVTDSPALATFTVVRGIAKREAPLLALTNSRVILSTIAEITFFGRDQTGHAVTATARASVDFGSFAN
jgi:hypothetical protein